MACLALHVAKFSFTKNHRDLYNEYLYLLTLRQQVKKLYNKWNSLACVLKQFGTKWQVSHFFLQKSLHPTVDLYRGKGSLDHLEEGLPLIDESGHFVERSAESRGPPTQLPSQQRCCRRCGGGGCGGAA